MPLGLRKRVTQREISDKPNDSDEIRLTVAFQINPVLKVQASIIFF
jgi:hypothetical protein